MIDRRIPPCYDCGAWDDEREGCTMPSFDRAYACPLEDERATECISQITEVLQKIADAIHNAIVEYRTQGLSDEEIVQILTKPDRGEDWEETE